VTVDQALADALIRLVAKAGAAIMALRTHELAVRLKSDQSPVTAADQAADAVIAAGLNEVLPGVPVVSEERVPADAAHLAQGEFVLVDPLDGTQEFIDGYEEFTVNLAILRDRYPVAGFIAVPARGLVYRGVVGGAAERLAVGPGGEVDCEMRTRIRTRTAPPGGLVATVSRSHLDAATEALIGRWPVSERLVAGSAVKFCRLAEGAADVYPRLGRVCEWDIAAGHALVLAAGGLVTDASGRTLQYGRAGYGVPNFVAWGDPDAARPMA
jgi:3'(2'), 5'-bisphosphate nucleotidase